MRALRHEPLRAPSHAAKGGGSADRRANRAGRSIDGSKRLQATIGNHAIARRALARAPDDTSASRDRGARPPANAGAADAAQRQEAAAEPATAADDRRIYPRVKVWINSFIPPAQVAGPPGYECFGGDGRGFSNDIHASSRTHQEIEFAPDLTETINWKKIGTTHEIDCDTGEVLASDTASVDALQNGPVSQGRTSAEVLVVFSASASNPLVSLAPAIDFEALFRINRLTRRCDLAIEHDGFPAYEAYVTADGGAGVEVYTYDPIAAGEGITALFPPMDESGRVFGVSF